MGVRHHAKARKNEVTFGVRNISARMERSNRLVLVRFPSLKPTVLPFSAPIFHQKFSILLRADDFSLIHHAQPLNCGRLP